ncbi:MAG: protein-glutamate O-methyltransferase CheR [Desulfobacterales bacterium]|nr:protein-glutamate O-methyltransferase CheR [Desulfobacterales bacterium]
MRKSEIEDIELCLFLDAVYERYGYDFRNYARASVKRRIMAILKKTGYDKISELIPLLLYDESFFSDIVYYFSVTVTEMFRDPDFFCAFRENIIPYLKTYPHIKVWHAGCASGEEAYSLAIVLKEEGLYDRATIYATDFNDVALKTAKNGIYSLENLKKYSSNYQKSGGTRSFSEYYHVKHESAVMNKSLNQRITFANHNLVTDAVFSEMHMIFCRNVLIYFNKPLQDRVLNLFDDSLIRKGFLCLGNKESLRFSSVSDKFQEVDWKERIYRKIDA